MSLSESGPTHKVDAIANTVMCKRVVISLGHTNEMQLKRKRIPL